MSFKIKNGILIKYVGNDKDIEIPSGVVEIDSFAFSNNKKIEFITFPPSLQRIRSIAFDRCINLKSLVLPASLTQIGNKAFSGCEMLEKVELPESLYDIGDEAFSYCNNLREINISENIKTIGKKIFEGCKLLQSNDNMKIVQDMLIVGNKLVDYYGKGKKVVIPEGVKEIQRDTFSYHRRLLEVVLPESLITIEDNAFYHCDDLIQINLPQNLKKIGKEAFRECESISNLILPMGLEYIGDKAFNYCINLESIIVPETVSYLGSGVFGGCKKLADKNGLVIVQDRVFEYCGKEKKIIIPDGITSIEPHAFWKGFDEESITEVVLPTSISSIGEEAFSNQNLLNKINLPSDLNYLGTKAFNGCEKLADEKGMVILNNILFAYYGEEENVVVPEGVISIEDSAFYRNNKIKNISLPSSLVEIGHSAFGGCKNLCTVSIKEGLKHIGSHAFWGCEKLENIFLPDGLLSIGENAFWSCNSITVIDIPYGITRIEKQVFYFCENLTEVTLPKGLARIEEEAFHCCYNLKNIILPEGLLYIGKMAFASCHELTDINIHEGLQSIEDNAFESCTNLKKIDLPTSLVNIGDAAFSSCQKIAEIKLPDNIESISDHTFSRCSKLKKVNLPAKLTYIGDKAFHWCDNLSKISIPDGVMYLGNEAFSLCSKLSKINIPDNLVYVGNDLFSGCNNLNSIEFNKSCFQFSKDIFGSRFPEKLYYQINIIYPAMTADAVKQYLPSIWPKLNQNDQAEIFLFEQSKPFTSVYSKINNRQINDLGVSILDILNTKPSARAYTGAASYISMYYKKADIGLIRNMFEKIESNGKNKIAVQNLKSNQEIRIILESGKDNMGFLDDEKKNVDSKEKAKKKNSTKSRDIARPKVDGDDKDKNKKLDNEEEKNSVNSSINEKLLSITDKINKLSHLKQDSYYIAKYDKSQNLLYVKFESQGTMYEGRSENIENITAGDPIQIVRDSQNKYNSNNFRFYTEQGKDVGNMPADICNELAPLYDIGLLHFADVKASYVEPLSKRGKRARKSILFIELYCEPKIISEQIQRIDNEIFPKPDEKEYLSNGTMTNLEEAAKITIIPIPAQDSFESEPQTDNSCGPYSFEKEQGFQIADNTDESEWKTRKIAKESYGIIQYLGKKNPIIVPAKIGKRSITGIYEGAFDFKYRDFGIRNLIMISDGITMIEDGAFRGHTKIISVVIPESVTSIGAKAFGDPGTENPPNVIIYGKKNSYAEEYSKNQGIPFIITCPGNDPIPEYSICGSTLVAYTGDNETPIIPENITRIGKCAFRLCNIISIELPEGITHIDDNAFEQCKNLKNISFPNSLTSIGKETFAYCKKIKKVSFPDSITSIGEGAFSWCTGIETISIPPDLSIIQPKTFQCCLLSEIRLSENLQVIGDSAFVGCSLKHVVIPKSVVYIGDSAFAVCESLEDITIPDTVENVNHSAFRDCKNLKINGDRFVILRNTLFAYFGKNKDVIVPENVLSINEKAFASLYEITSLTLPDGLQRIEKQAFCDCTGLRTINIPDSVHTIAPGAFKNCYRLKNIAVPYGVSKIEKGVFFCCRSLSNVSLPESITSIEEEAFCFCSKIKEIIIPAGVKHIGKEAFNACRGLEKVYLPESLETIGEGVFSHWDSKKLKLFVYENSVAEEYAIKNKLKYELIPRKSENSPDGIQEISENGSKEKIADQPEINAVSSLYNSSVMESTQEGEKQNGDSEIHIDSKPKPESSGKGLGSGQNANENAQLPEQIDSAAVKPAQDDILPEPENSHWIDRAESTLREDDNGTILQAAEGINELLEGETDSEISSSEDSVGRSDERNLRTDLPSASSSVDQKTAWIRYQAYEVVCSGRASAYYFFDLRNEMTLGIYNWQSDDFLYVYMKYFPGMSPDQLRLLRTQAIPWLNEPNTCNSQYQIVMQDTFEHRYVMIASAWFSRAVNFFEPSARAQFVFNACRTFFYPHELQEVWNRLWNESMS